MNAFLRRFLMHYEVYRRYPSGGCPPCATHGARPAPDANQDANNLWSAAADRVVSYEMVVANHV
jgi:hypothetical protein